MSSDASGFCYWSATGALNSAVCLRERSIPPVLGGFTGATDLTGIC